MNKKFTPVFIGIGAAVYVGFGCWFFNSFPKKVCSTGKVVVIGGCDHHGTCRVKLDNGSLGWAPGPIVGEVSEACHED